MTPERWQRVSDLYEAVLERPAGEREAFVAGACADDSALRREIQLLSGASGGAIIPFKIRHASNASASS